MYGPAFLTGGALVLTLGGPGLLWLGLIMFKIGILGFELHLIKEAQRVGWFKTKKQVICF